MTIGIYCLTFSGTNKVYIGQSINIEKRYMQHKRSFLQVKASVKLQEAYNLYGIPSLSILLECNIEELNSSEKEAIEIYDSSANGYNTYIDSYQAPVTQYGEDSGNSKYSNEVISKVFKYLVSQEYLPTEHIADLTNVDISTIRNILARRSHNWLSLKYPEEYSKLQEVSITRLDKSFISVSNKLSALAKGIVYPKIKNPAGDIFQVDNAESFARTHSLAGNHLREVLKGIRKSHKGWKLV